MGMLSGYSPTKVADCLNKKLYISLSSGGELAGWYWLDGKKRLHVSVPKGHSRELSKRVTNNIINNLKLSKEEFRLLYNCPMKGRDYENKIRNLIDLGIL